ncbi:unnamed protein product [Caenorhabditis nigoni]
MKNPFLLAILIVTTYCSDFNESEFFKSKCDASCIFDGDLNSTTIGSFPSTCTTICARLGIDNNCDLSENQLTLAFQNMKHLIGSLILYRTKFTSAKFLLTLESVECGLADFTISYNPKMEEIGMTNLTTIKCSLIDIHGNEELKKLNIPDFKYASPSAENLEANKTEIEINIDSEKYGFCITSVEMYNFMNIENVNLKKLGGGICEPGIQPSSGKLCNASHNVDEETEIQDGCRDLYDFKIAYNPKMEEVGMTNLTTIKCSFIGIHENKELKKLNIPAFKFASPSAENLGTNNTEIEIQIDSEKYGFCITSVEMCNFINIENVNLKKLGGGICEPGIQPSSGKLCNASYEVFMETEIQDGYTLIQEANTRPPYKLAKNLDLIFVGLLMSVAQIL